MDHNLVPLFEIKQFNEDNDLYQLKFTTYLMDHFVNLCNSSKE